MAVSMVKRQNFIKVKENKEPNFEILVQGLSQFSSHKILKNISAFAEPKYI